MVTEQVRHDRAIELWHRTIPDATRVAVLMGTGIDAAQAISASAFRRASWLWMQRRDADVFEVWLLRYVIRMASRRTRRSPAGGPPDDVLKGPDKVLWNRLRSLRPRHRAAIVLASYKGLRAAGVADVLQTSAGGAAALLERARADLRTAAVEEGRLEQLLARIAGEAPLPDWDRSGIRRVHLSSKTAGGVLLIAVVIVLGVGVAFIGSQITTVYSDGANANESPVAAPERLSAEIPPSQLLGAPGWCPSIEGMLPLRSQDGIEAVGVASRLNVGLINNYHSSVRHLFERPEGAPNPLGWSTTTDDAGTRVIMSVPAEANRVLAAECGNFIARRTWEVVLEHAGPPSRDGVAFFLVRRQEGMNVWGTYPSTGP